MKGLKRLDYFTYKLFFTFSQNLGLNESYKISKSRWSLNNEMNSVQENSVQAGLACLTGHVG
jgi:hypothetical protein